MVWLVKRDDGVYYNEDACWSESQSGAHLYHTAADARSDARVLSRRGESSRPVRLVPKRKRVTDVVLTTAAGTWSMPVYVADSPDAHAAQVATAHEAGRISERNRWVTEFRSRARTLRQWAEEARGKGQGVVARTNDICAAQLDVIADAVDANDPSQVELP